LIFDHFVLSSNLLQGLVVPWAAEPTLLLVLQSTVDQLGGDLPGRFIKLMGEGGIRYLIDNGVWYADADGHSL